MIKAVLFDYDGVLTLHETGTYSTCLYLSRAGNIDFDPLITCYRKYTHDLLAGTKTYPDVWASLCSELNKQIDIKILYDAFRSTPLNREMYRLIRRIRKSYKTALVTDNKKERMNVLIKKHRLNKIFDSLAISAEIGSGKWERRIFDKVFTDLQVRPEECVFTDNHAANLEIPRKLGVKVIHYHFASDNAGSLENRLRQYLIPG